MLLKQAQCIQVRPMLEPDRDRIGTSEHAPQLRVVPIQQAVSAHWNDLADAGNEAAYCSAWLFLQCARIAGVTAGVVVLRQPDMPSPAVSACWPTQNFDGFADLSKLAERAFLERRPIVSPHPLAPRQWFAALFGRPFGRDAARGWGTDHSCCRRQAGCLARFRSSVGRTGRRATPLGCWLARIFAFGASLESFFAGCGAHLGVLGRAGRGRGAAAAAGRDDRYRQQPRHKTSM